MLSHYLGTGTNGLPELPHSASLDISSWGRKKGPEKGTVPFSGPFVNFRLLGEGEATEGEGLDGVGDGEVLAGADVPTRGSGGLGRGIRHGNGVLHST